MTAALEGGEWSAARPGRTLPPGKTRYPFYRRLGGPPGPVWTGGKSRPHRDSVPDRPVRSQSLYRLSYPAHIYIYVCVCVCVCVWRACSSLPNFFVIFTFSLSVLFLLSFYPLSKRCEKRLVASSFLSVLPSA